MRDFSARLIRAAKALLSAVWCAALFAGAAGAQTDQSGRWENGVGEPWRFTEETTHQREVVIAQQRWKLIGDELGSSRANQWAGDYFEGGDTSGRYLRWSPRAGFVLMHVNKCAAYVRNFSYGRVKVTPTSVEFYTEQAVTPSSLDRRAPRALPTKFVPAKWRGVRYLLEEKEVAGFGNYVAGLGEYNPGAYGPELAGVWLDGTPFFSDMAEWEGPADEPPSLPPGYERFIKKAIDAEVVSVGARVVKTRRSEFADEPYYESETKVTVNSGSADGVKPGMVFYVLAAGPLEQMTVRSVRQHSASGVIVRSLKEEADKPPVLWKDDEEAGYSPLAAGRKVSTSQFKITDPLSSN